MKYKCFIFLFFTFFNSFSQNGNTSYQFLNFETSPRSVAMGGDLIPFTTMTLISQKTPSILNSEMNNNLSFSFIDYFSDINIIFAKNFTKIAIFLLVLFLQIMVIIQTSENGDQISDFTASDQMSHFLDILENTRKIKS